MEKMSVRTNQRQQLLDITRQVQQYVSDTGFEDGLVCLFVPHTTAAVTINENADPDVAYDVLNSLAKTYPELGSYRHREGNSDAHVKSSLVAPSLMVIVENGKLQLGTWQAIYFAEFDGPRSRECWIKTISS